MAELAVFGGAAVRQVSRAFQLEHLACLHVRSSDLPALQGLVHSDLEHGRPPALRLPRVLENVMNWPAIIARDRSVVHRGPVLWLALPALFPAELLVEDLDPVDVLLYLVGTVIEVVVVVVEDLEDLAAIFRPVLVVELFQRLHPEVAGFGLGLLLRPMALLLK